MTGAAAPASTRSYLIAGAVAGALSTVGFALIHDLFISDIWSSVGVMMVAGALCGLCIAWSFAVVVATPSLARWFGYNALLVLMIALLGLTSVLVFDPVVSFAALLDLDGPPDDLIRQALPMTVVFTLGGSVVLSLVFRRDWAGFGAILVANVILIALLGLNVSIIGLVDIPTDALYLVLELFGLIVSIGAVYAAVFAALERKRLATPRRT